MMQWYGTNTDQMNAVSCLVFMVFVAMLNVQPGNSHGRLIEPPSRASAWRYGFNTPPDYNDHELYCGGFTRQWKNNAGKCGECGDAWDLPEPRPHEDGGQWGQGVIVRRYRPESDIKVRVELTASHMGYFEFRLCPEPKARQQCFDKFLLPVIGGSPSQPAPEDLDTRFYPRNGSRIYEIEVQLPNINCSQCVLQWRYIAGNNWGMCPDGTHGAVGCGPQEEFRSCSDIALGEDTSKPLRPIRPTARPTQHPKTYTTSTESNFQDTSTKTFNYTALLVVSILLFLAMCLFGLWYLKHKNHPVFNYCKESFQIRFCKKAAIASDTRKSTLPAIISLPVLGYPLKGNRSQPSSVDVPSSAPIPPPRTKRQSRTKDMASDSFSIA